MSYQMRRRPRWHAGAGAAFVTALAVLAGSLAASTGPGFGGQHHHYDRPVGHHRPGGGVADVAGGLNWVKRTLPS